MTQKLLPSILSICAVFFIVIIRYVVDPALAINDSPFLLFLLPILAVARYNSIAPSVLTLIAATLIAVYLLIMPSRGAPIFPVSILLQIFSFLLIGCSIIFMTHKLKRANYLLRCHANNLEQESRQKDEFFSMASHELKTPITSIKMFIQMLQKRVQGKDTYTYTYLRKIDSQINNLTTMINDFLDVSKIQANKITYKHEPFFYQDLLTEIIEQLQPTTTTHQIVLRGSIKKWVNGDRQRIGQILINLIGNAIKYSPDRKRVIVRVSATREIITTEIQDFGIGISPEDQEHIFARFYQAHHDTPSRFTGLGLGLYISCEIIKHHNAKIWLTSKEGKGSSFYFTLPVYHILA
jgi:signal transduction histidine kinase